MSRQLAIGAIIGFALAVLGLALWERPASQAAAAQADAGPPPAQRPLPTLQLRGEPVPMTGRALHAPKVLVDGADGGG